MKLHVLIDNQAAPNLEAEHGLSYFIEHNGFKLLFDTGHSDKFLKNAKRLNIDINQAQTVVLSHGHWDHGNGLKYLGKNKSLICHPYSFFKRYRVSDGKYIGLDSCFLDLNKKFKLINTRNPYPITDEIVFLGEIPRLNDFEAQDSPFLNEHGEKDFMLDDSAIVIIQNDEIIVISGCAHAGICNTIEYAKKITEISKVKTIIGGFHLKENNQQTQETIAYLKNQNLENIYPAHCTQGEALNEFRRNFNCPVFETGTEINI